MSNLTLGSLFDFNLCSVCSKWYSIKSYTKQKELITHISTS